MEISKKQWQEVLDKHQDKIDENEALKKTLAQFNEKYLNLSETTKDIKERNKKLIYDIDIFYIKYAKLQKELDTTNSSLSGVLETLHEALNTLEHHGLRKNNTKDFAHELDLLA